MSSQDEYGKIEDYEILGFQEKNITFKDGSQAYYNPTLWPIYETMRHKLKDKHHNVVTISGRVGTGKSEFSFQMGKYLNPNFGIEDVYWDTDSLIKAASSDTDIKPPGTVFVFDEAREGTQSLNAMSETNRRIGLFLDTIRSRRYHIILTQPSPWLFQRSIFIYASDIHFHIEKKGNHRFIEALARGDDPDSVTEKTFERGYVRIYDAEQKKKLYIKGKELEDLNVSSSTMCTFKKSKGIIDWDEYDSRKSKAVAAMNAKFDLDVKEKISPKQERIMKFKEKAYYLLQYRYGMRVGEICAYFDVEQSEVSNFIKARVYELENMKHT